jgi:hypothetical protein
MWSSHPISILEAFAILKGSNLLPIVLEFSESYFIKLRNFLKQIGEIETSNLENLGKLSFKEEAAGKVRVFALVDVITQ